MRSAMFGARPRAPSRRRTLPAKTKQRARRGEKGRDLGRGSGTWRVLALGLTLGLASATPVGAHPHGWVTVKSQIAFTSDGKVAAVVHDWVFDEMYSSFATQGLAP